MSGTTSANASTSNVARNALLGYVCTAFGVLSGLIVTPIVLHRIGTAQFGLWTLLNSAIAYGGLVELGIGTALVKRVAECRATGDRRRLENLLGAGLSMYMCMAILAMAVACVLALFVDHLFHIASADLTRARLCLLVLGLELAVRLAFNAQTAVLVGVGRMDLTARASLFIIVLSAAANIWVVSAGLGIVGLAWVLYSTTVLNCYIIFRVVVKFFPEVGLHLRYTNKQSIRELFKFGSRNALITLCATLAYYSDTLIIGALLPVSNVAHYAIASKLSKLILTFAGKPIEVLIPAYSHSDALNDKTRQFTLFTESVMLTLALALPCIIVMCGFGAQIIRLWVGPGHDVSYPILVVLSLTLAFQLPGYACFSLVTGTERNAFLVKMLCISAPANFGLSIILTRLYGAIGVALGSLIAVSVADFIVLPIYVCRHFEFDYRNYLVRGYGPVIFPTIATSLLVILLRFVFVLPGLLGTLVSSASVFILFWTLLLTKGLSATRRDRYVRKLRGVMSL